MVNPPQPQAPQQQSQQNELNQQPNNCASISSTNTHYPQMFPFFNMSAVEAKQQYLPVQGDQGTSIASTPSPPAGFGNTPTFIGETGPSMSPTFSYPSSPVSTMTTSGGLVNFALSPPPTISPSSNSQDREKNRNYLFSRRKRHSLTDNLDLVVRQRRSGISKTAAITSTSER